MPMNPDATQIDMFESQEWWESHWVGMPEYDQKDLMPYKTIKIHFENKKDLLDFAKLVNQKITPKTSFLWYPEKTPNKCSDKIYISNLTDDLED